MCSAEAHDLQGEAERTKVVFARQARLEGVSYCILQVPSGAEKTETHLRGEMMIDTSYSKRHSS